MASDVEDNGRYELALLGYWRLSRNGNPLMVRTQLQRLVAFLAVSGPSSRPFLCGELWPETTDCRALDSLRVAIHLAGRELPGILRLAGPVVMVHEGVDIDLNRERTLLAAEAGTWTVENAKTNTDAKRRLPEGRLLPGWYEDWAVRAQADLEQSRIVYYESRGRRLLEAGDLHAAADAALCALFHDPLNESAMDSLVRAHIALGSHITARRLLRNFRSILLQEHTTSSSPMLDDLDRLLDTVRG